MINLLDIILILVILYLLNYLKINNKKNNKKNIEKYTNKESELENIDKIMKTKDYKLLYGKEQYIANNVFNEPKYLYQDIDFLKENNKFKLDEELDFSYDEEKLINDFHAEKESGIVATLIPPNLPHYTKPQSDQRTLYDYKFEEPKARKLEKIIKMENVDLENKTIKEVYEDLIMDYKKLNPQKIPKNTQINKKVNGAFGEKSLSNVEWEYEIDDSDLKMGFDMGFDPNQTLELALN